MNVDLFTLSTAVHQAANINQKPSINNGAGGKTTAPCERRRSRRGSIDAQKFVEAAHKSWTFNMEDLPEGNPAMQRRRSSRNYSSMSAFDKKELELFAQQAQQSWSSSEGTEVDTRPHKKWMNTKDVHPSIKKKSSKKQSKKEVKPKEKQQRRRNSGSNVSPSVLHPPEEQQQQPLAPLPTPAENSGKLGKKLARRSSLTCFSERSLAEEKTNREMRKAITPASSPAKPSKGSNSPKKTKKRRPSLVVNNAAIPPSPAITTTKTCTTTTPAVNKGPVRFELDHKNRIKRRVSIIRTQASRSTDDRKLWWSDEELDRIYERESGVYEKFAADRSYQKKIRHLWSSCSKASSASATTSPDAIAHIAGASSRGLEVDILETVRERRLRVIGSVLDAQVSLRDFDGSIRSNVLSARYRNLCRSAARFARKMAEGDAIVAANVYSH